MKRITRLTESDLHRIVKESVKRVLNEGGRPITAEQAGQMLMSYADNNEFGDRFYEFAQDLCNRAIQDIESKYTIVDVDGVPYTDEDEEMWYDDYRDDFMKAVFEKIQTGQF